MSSDLASSAHRRAVDLSGNAGVVEGPLHGYHHETYVFPLPAEVGRVRVKCREPRSNLFWYDRRCFASEEELVRALQGQITGIPEIVEVEGLGFQRFIEGETLGARYRSGSAISPAAFEQIVCLFRELARIRPGAITADRRCKPQDRPADGDSAGFLERLILFTEDRVYQENLPDFAELFASLGVDEDTFKRLRKHVSGLTERPFCLLHADLHRENFIVDHEERLWTIDWELAMVGDPLYDLATHLYLMRYPSTQGRLMALRWEEAVEGVLPGSSTGWEQDLPKLLGYKRVQSVFTDVIRLSLSLGAVPQLDVNLLARTGAKLRRVLATAAEPLGLERPPDMRHVVNALVGWYRRFRARGTGNTS